ncbi:hypothetical protein A3D12_03600 [Candidatus Peribacteria bacterium RIFCSPHIGHO2_02_FULL_55_24]|nr:MAG: hypothetical protein A3D12_03600 [Candidatus Peribacteria bacterium RIFCSPHIGHO2_02_FULL_55_24]OGJ64201.1 MAG: hypothetical protein A3E47_04000 [Candidatus Peribacteria bacterium RIFCSPHIGHO2_12_FULL_54_10]
MPKQNHTLLHLLIERVNALSYETLAFLWIGVILGSTGLYFIVGSSPVHGLTTIANLTPHAQFWNSLYFSIITATTVGYGDITPLGFSRVVAATESVTAFAIFAILVAKLVSNRQETRMERIEQLMLRNASEGKLYRGRKHR